MTQIESSDLVKPGSVVRFSGGGPFFVSGGQKNRLTLPRLFRVQAVFKKRPRIYLEVFGLEKVGGIYTVFVEGKPYRSEAGLRMRPYRVKRKRVRIRSSFIFAIQGRTMRSEGPIFLGWA